MPGAASGRGRGSGTTAGAAAATASSRYAMVLTLMGAISVGAALAAASSKVAWRSRRFEPAWPGRPPVWVPAAADR